MSRILADAKSCHQQPDVQMRLVSTTIENKDSRLGESPPRGEENPPALYHRKTYQELMSKDITDPNVLWRCNVGPTLVYYLTPGYHALRAFLPEDIVYHISQYDTSWTDMSEELMFAYVHDPYETPLPQELLTAREWYVRERCACGRLYSRRHDDLIRYRRCRRCPAREHFLTHIARIPRSPELYTGFSFDNQAHYAPHASFAGKTFDVAFEHRDWFGSAKSLVRNAALASGMRVPSSTMRRVEDLILYLATLSTQTSPQGAVLVTLTYLKTHCTTSIYEIFSQYISSLFGVEPQSSDSSFVDTIKGLQTNWKSCVQGKFFTQVSKLLGIVVMSGLCSADKVTLKCKDFVILAPDLLDRHKNAIDMIDAIFETIGYFAENTYLSVKEGSLQPLLFGATFADSLTDDYQKCLLWWSLARNGNLEKVAEVEEHDFLALLTDVTKRLRLVVSEAVGIEKSLLERKVLELARINNEFTTMKMGQQVRRAPYVIEICGSSMQGKTTVTDQIIQSLLISAGLSTDRTRRAPVNASEKYMSAWTTNKDVMIIDDFGNEKPETVETNPTRLIVDVANNQTFIANMADIAQKGSVFVEPEIVVITTNKKDLCAGSFSCCPYSIQRRADVVITVKAKNEFQNVDRVSGAPQGLSAHKVAEHYKKNGQKDRPFIEDLWHLKVEKAVAPQRLDTVAGYEVIAHPRVVDDSGKPALLEDIGLPKLVPLLIERFNEHRENQAAVLEASKNREAMQQCPIEGCNQIHGFCPIHKYVQPHSALVDAAKRSKALITEKVIGEMFGLQTGLDTGSAALMMCVARRFCWQFSIMKVVPSQWIQCSWFQDVYKLAHYEDMKRMWIRRTCTSWGLAIATSTAFFLRTPQKVSLPVTAASAFVATCATAAMRNNVESWFVEKMHRENVVGDVVRQWRDTYMSGLAAGCATVAGAYALYKAWNAYKAMSPHSFVRPSMQEIHQRDMQPDVWCKVERDELPQQVDRTVSPDILQQLVQKNLYYVTLTDAEARSSHANALMLTSNVYVLPTHYITQMTLPISIRFTKMHCDDKKAGLFFTSTITGNYVSLPGQDLSIVHTPNGGSFRDLIKHLATDLPSTYPAKSVYRTKEGYMSHMTARIETGMTSNNAMNEGVRAKFKGGNYAYLSAPTFRGMCGMPFVMDRNGAKIVGIHVGGIAGTPEGCMHHIDPQEVLKAIAHFKSQTSITVTASAEHHESAPQGKSYMIQGPISEKSPVAYLPEGSTIRVHGLCTGKVTPMSTVRETVISQTIGHYMGVHNKWGPPLMRPSYWPYQTCLSNLCRPSKEFHSVLVEKSVMDYLEPLLDGVTDEWLSKPLSEHENVNGVPGKKFLDALVLSTSAGFPYKGKKAQFIEDVEAVGNRTLTIEARNLIAGAEAKFARGERAFLVAKACTKDEVLPQAKKKCRIFYACSFELVYLARKYYLPVLRYLQMYPAIAECAVGANCFGPDWQALMEHASSKGQMIAGDYSKYDQTLPSQLIIAALKILTRIAQEMGYSDSDLATMEGMIGDLVYPLINFNGDLISLTEGGWISGVPMTVHVNGICGSLLMRCAFFTMYPSLDEFRPYVALLTYGDDNIGSVHDRCTAFNIKSVSEFLAPFGMRYTMPDKDSALVDFLPLDEIEFLKRKSSFIEEIGLKIGALNEDSIFKSLHCQLAPKDGKTPREASAELLEGALREWFCHGRKVFEERHAQVKKVVAAHDLACFMPSLDQDFDYRVSAWKAKYSPRSHMGDAEKREVEEYPAPQDTTSAVTEQQTAIVGMV